MLPCGGPQEKHRRTEEPAKRSTYIYGLCLCNCMTTSTLIWQNTDYLLFSILGPPLLFSSSLPSSYNNFLLTQTPNTLAPAPSPHCLYLRSYIYILIFLNTSLFCVVSDIDVQKSHNHEFSVHAVCAFASTCGQTTYNQGHQCFLGNKPIYR